MSATRPRVDLTIRKERSITILTSCWLRVENIHVPEVVSVLGAHALIFQMDDVDLEEELLGSHESGLAVPALTIEEEELLLAGDYDDDDDDFEPSRDWRCERRDHDRQPSDLRAALTFDPLPSPPVSRASVRDRLGAKSPSPPPPRQSPAPTPPSPVRPVKRELTNDAVDEDEDEDDEDDDDDHRQSKRSKFHSEREREVNRRVRSGEFSG